MSIFTRIKNAIFGDERPAEAAAPKSAGAPKPVVAPKPAATSGIPASPADAKWEREVDVEAVLEARSANNPQKLNWRTSIVDLMKCLPEQGHPMDVLQAAVAALGMFYPGRNVKDMENNYWSAVRLIAKLPTIIAGWARLRRGDDAIAPRDDLAFSENFFYMLTETMPDPVWVEIFDDCLILHAEHTMNASTFTGLVTASTLADPYTVVASSLGALKGPLHGGANEEVVQMLKEIGTVDQAARYVEQRFHNKQKLMGFGHRVYKVKDPRATILQSLCEKLFSTCGTSQLYDIAVRVERRAVELLDGKKVYPNVDFYSGIIYDKMGIDSDLFTPIFAMARVSGWLAHWLEQLRENKLFRPDQIYAGEHNRPYVPLDQR